MADQGEQVRHSVEQRASPAVGHSGVSVDRAMTADASGAPAVVAFVGRSGSGKTTLLLQLIPILRARQIRVAVVKHSSHRGIDSDAPGSDSRRFWDAGVDEVALVTPDRVAYTRRVASEPRLDEVLSVVRGAGLVLLEGFKGSDVPKIEVIRTACTRVPLEGLRGRVACVTDVVDLGLDCPVFSLEDVQGVADFLMERLVAPD